jgi:ketosteroid isomerase-like protein
VDVAAVTRTLVEADHAFGQRAGSAGLRDALLATLADDAVLFQPRPTTGRLWATSNAVPTGTYSWEPAWAVLASSGDLGVTSGPIAYHATVPTAAPDSATTGQYVTVWSRVTGTWKAVLSMHLLGPQASSVAFTTHQAAADGRPRGGPGAAEASRATLFIADRGLAAAAMASGAATAVSRVVLQDVRLLRAGALPFLGADSARAGLMAHDEHDGVRTLWQTQDVRMARSADLGVAYGIYERRDASNAVVASGGYIRVWERQPDGGWRIVLDAEN